MAEVHCPHCGRSLAANTASPSHAALAAEVARLTDLLDAIGRLARDAVAATSSAVWRREALEKVLLHIAALASVRDMGGEHA